MGNVLGHDEILGSYLALSLDVNLAVCELSGEQRVLTLVADREGELIIRNDSLALLLLGVGVGNYHAEYLGGLERLLDELLEILAPQNNVDLLALEFLGNGVDTGLLSTYARAHCVNVGVVADDRDLGARTSRTADSLDLNSSVVDLGALKLEQTLDEASVGSGDAEALLLRALLIFFGNAGDIFEASLYCCFSFCSISFILTSSSI